MTESIYDFSAETRSGKPIKLKNYKNKVLLIVNTATGCGFTPQYEGLEKLYQKYHKKGLEILDFPCDQFGHQAPGTDDEIHAFCTARYHTSFDQLKKIEVNGGHAHPLYVFLKSAAPGKLGKGIKWNFTKFLISRDGQTITRFAPTTTPEALEPEIEKLLGAQ